MEQTPNALRKHVVLLGSTNAGKSTLFNALTGQDRAIVSPTPGTTTDPVRAPMELIPFGPIVLVDTAGLGDRSGLGEARIRRTKNAVRSADAALYVADARDFSEEDYRAFQAERLPHLLVFNRWRDGAQRQALHRVHPDALFLGADAEISDLRGRLAALLSEQEPDDLPLLGDLLPAGSHVVLVTPIDSAAPKGRLILPQVQVLRECLDCGICATVCREHELETALHALRRVDMVVTDSQAFAYVDARTPKEVPLTSFSMLLARQKGDFAQLLAGARALDTLPDGARVLMLEGCTHNQTHEDIGRVKLPALLKKKRGAALTFTFCAGYDFPDDLTGYALAIQCGNCMIHRREAIHRLERFASAGIPVTNYGMALAWGAGILARASAPFATG